jgi:hypothetical protein
VLLACIGVALALGVGALSASARAPSFARSILGTDDSVAVAIGDLDGDGRADIVTANYNPESISVGLNRGGGRFGNGGEYRVGGLARSVAIGDVNGDGKPDLVAANYSVNPNSDPDTISVLPNAGDGRFGDRRDYPVEGKPAAIAISDLNGDDKPDLAIASDVTDTVFVLPNRGDGNFLSGTSHATGRRPLSLAIGDLNGDGQRDLVTANVGANTVSVLLNRGGGSFEVRHDYRSGRSPGSVAIGDVNGDDKPDLAIANLKDATVSVLLNRGDGSFQPKHGYRTGTFPFSIVMGDLNRDGRADLATANAGLGTVSVLLNRGDGSLRPKLDYVPGLELYGWGSIAIGDVNGDRRLDLAVPMIDSRNGSSSLSLLINTPGLCNVQNVVGMTLPAAKRTLARINCRVGKVSHAYSKGMKRGRVISTKPWFGAVRPEGAKINLVVSKGRRG